MRFSEASGLSTHKQSGSTRRIGNSVIAVLVAISLFMIAQSASPARAERAGSFNATSIQEWQGNVTGALSAFWVDSPGLGSGEHWERYIEIATGGWEHVLQFGVEKCGSSGAGCPICGVKGAGAGLWEFEVNSPGNNINCERMPNDALNTQRQFAIYENTLDASILEWQVMHEPGGSDMPCSVIACEARVSKPGSQTWSHIQLVEVIKATFTTHEVWGGNWTLNQWMNSNRQFVYQTNSGFTRQGPGNPPQMGWFIASYSFPPSAGNRGGSLASCDYPSGTHCNWRS